MQKNCVAKGCSSAIEENGEVSFFQFPRHSEDADLLEHWKLAVGRPGWTPDEGSLLCSRHFAPDSFVSGMEGTLRPGAVPNIALGNQVVDMMDSDYEQFMSNEDYEELDDEDMLSEDCSPEDYCRVCATRGFGKLYPIFGRQGEQWRIVEKISSCLPINVSQTDKISLHICTGCLRKLDASYDFIVMALESDASFQEKFPSDWWNQARVPFLDCDSDEEGSDQDAPLIKEEFVSVKEEEIGELGQGDNLGSDEGSLGLFGSCGKPVQIDGPITCDICNCTFTNMNAFDNHIMREHRSGFRWPCPLCDMGFNDPSDLLAHKVTLHIDDMASCSKCSQIAGFRCNVCNSEFATAAEIREHCLTHTTLVSKTYLEQGILELDCKQCGVTFETSAEKEQHDVTHVSDMTCVTCSKTFTNEAIYRKHRNLHDPKCWDQFRCAVCQRPCRDAEALRNHTALHTGSKMHMCDLCGRTYNRYANMLKHRKQHKPRALWKHRCEHCDNMFEQLRDLTAHQQSVHGLSVATTDTGKKKSAVKWVCRFCGKVISTKLSLQDHERIHTGAKPFVCEWCGREFRSRPNLLQHHLTHTGDRRHACGICGKRFSRKSFITQHMRVHTGEKPFVCDICGHRFTQAGDMRRHRKRHIEAQEEVAVVLQLAPSSL